MRNKIYFLFNTYLNYRIVLFSGTVIYRERLDKLMEDLLLMAASLDDCILIPDYQLLECLQCEMVIALLSIVIGCPNVPS